MSETPGIDIPPSVMIDGLRQELAATKDENSIMRIKIDFLNATVAALQSALDQVITDHTHDDESDDKDDTPSE